jgi:predicted amidohydrolase
MRVALIQTNATGDAARNGERALALIREAADSGAEFVATPEVTNLIAPGREALFATIHDEADDPCLAAIRALAAERGLGILIGSLALKAEGEAERAVNRSFLIDGRGEIVARYDKIHMFEADLGSEGRFREAASYRPGERAITADAGWASLGLTICYDLRFPALYRALAKAGAQVLTVPSAFTAPTGRAHWHILLRARAIETGCFVIAPAQWGPHHGEDETSLRESYGHSLIVDPWGTVLADAGEGEGVVHADLDLTMIEKARKRIPSLSNDRDWGL